MTKLFLLFLAGIRHDPMTTSPSSATEQSFWFGEFDDASDAIAEGNKMFYILRITGT